MRTDIITRQDADIARRLPGETPWQEVLDAFLLTLDSPMTRRAYARACTDAMTALGVGKLSPI
jgi:hypothetical protein